MRMMQHEDTYPHSHWLALKRPVVRPPPPPPPPPPGRDSVIHLTIKNH